MTDAPLLRVVRGNPDDAELAALTAVVVSAASASAPAPAPRRTSWWGDRAAAVHAPLAPGDGAWRASSLPR
ncbi:acyl-CoA carboxylase epsilon subunit-like protein [Amycolatopsis echigonensis]|uniref:Acyl-CoA carboxylase epsilon subunit-like protein n=1 Tax=Amycolatopsis echigonensis TaxID=2576905 RepID=A0A2N3WD97_9PSEU|nr:acyl-CoA carboxylase subunit epsilon [Amycolatopsis niigatensis]PKV91862.1 acyl-CoA carboxylase epsilon subunit-like protein [Amycolatopsis niigatensis]